MQRHRARQLLVLGLAWLPTTATAADTRPPLSGRWEAGPLRVQLTLDGWTSDCGKPPAESGDAGGYVDVRQSQTELWIYGHDRPFSTSSCWERRPGASRVDHSGGTRSWSTTCKQESDHSVAVIRSTTSATDDSIHFVETTDYRFDKAGRVCTAKARRTRTYHLVERRNITVTAPAAFDVDKRGFEAVAPGPGACDQPGQIRMLTISPERDLVPTGGSLRFNVNAMDAAGCRIHRPLVTWSVPDGVDGLTFSNPLTLDVGESAPEGPLTLVAKVGDMKRDVQLHIVSRERFDALLAARTVKSGEPVAQDPTPEAPASVAAGVAVAEDRARRRKYIFALIAAVTATLLGALGAVIMRRARPQATSPHTPVPPPSSAPEPIVRRICPTCGSMYGTDAEFCGKDGSFLVQAN